MTAFTPGGHYAIVHAPFSSRRTATTWRKREALPQLGNIIEVDSFNGVEAVFDEDRVIAADCLKPVAQLLTPGAFVRLAGLGGLWRCTGELVDGIATLTQGQDDLTRRPVTDLQLVRVPGAPDWTDLPDHGLVIASGYWQNGDSFDRVPLLIDAADPMILRGLEPPAPGKGAPTVTALRTAIVSWGPATVVPVQDVP
ncbi:hypothetical protein V6N00_12775 [Tersicoccus sp. MR15.9]|uniref:hypothetical protein n=1 Tax=Tersicoccus mangrovi TaxID=3121635 RepID=UPI002FE58DFA